MKRQNFSHSMAQAGQDSCIALIDARFLAWLQGQSEGAMEQVRFQLNNMLSSALAHTGLDVDLVRVYWYSDSQDDLVVDGQITRCVVAHNQDGGVSMLRTLGGDIKRLAERGACTHLLIGSDDERLLPLIDDAQLHGMGVHLLADEAARNMGQLQRDDAGWARLLAQADRRVVLSAHGGAREGGHPRHAATSNLHSAPAMDPEQMREQLSTVINAWWTEEPEDLREDLREELQNSRGVPQEVDRQLLLAARRVLERALSFHEKKMLREMVREVVLGGHAVPVAQPAHAE